MPDIFKPYISRIIASLVAGFVGWLASKHIDISGDTAAQAISAITAIVGTLFSIIYAILHKLIDKVVNPTDAAAQANIQHGVELKESRS